MIYYNIHNLILVQIEPTVEDSIIEQIDFQISYFRVENIQKCPFNIKISKYDDSIKNFENFSIFHQVSGLWGKNYHDVQNKLSIVREKNGFHIFANTPFVINIFIQLCLIEKGITCIHAAAHSKNNDVTLLPGPGGVGKTAILGYTTNAGDKVLGDDIILVNNESKAFSFPRSFVLKEYHRTVYPDLFKKIEAERGMQSNKKLEIGIKSLFKKSIRFILKNLPFYSFLHGIVKNTVIIQAISKQVQTNIFNNNDPYFAYVPLEEVLGENVVDESGDIKKIVFLERYNCSDFEYNKITHDELCNRMFSIIHHEWVDSMRLFFSLGALGMIDISKYFNDVNHIIRSFTKDIPSYILHIPNGCSPEDLAKFYKSI